MVINCEMSSFFQKTPIDASNDELNSFLIGKGYSSAQKLIRSDKVKLTEKILSDLGRTTLIVSEPKSWFDLGDKVSYFINRYRTKKLNKDSLFNPVDDLSSPELPLPPTRTNRNFEVIESEPRSFLPNQTPRPRTHPLDPEFSPNEHAQTLPRFSPLNFSRDSSPAAANLTPKVNFELNNRGHTVFNKSESNFSKIEGQRGQSNFSEIPDLVNTEVQKSADNNLDHLVENFAGQNISRPEFNRATNLDNFEATPMYTKPKHQSTRQHTIFSPDASDPEKYFSRAQGSGHIKTKFLLKFDNNKISIESYCLALDRWRLSNDASDLSTIMVGIQNFSNVNTANYIYETLSEDAKSYFDIFVSELKIKLGKNKRQWYSEFQNTTRDKSETCFELHGKLTQFLKLALGLDSLSEEHKGIITEKFLSCLNHTLRGILEARDNEVTYEDVAIIANRVELAQNIDRVPRASINHTAVQYKPDQSQPVEPQPVNKQNFRPQVQNYGTSKLCTLCNRSGHIQIHCYGNPLSQNFNLEKFQAIMHLKNQGQA